MQLSSQQWPIWNWLCEEFNRQMIFTIQVMTLSKLKMNLKLNSAQLNALAGMKDKLSEAMGTGVAQLLAKFLLMQSTM